MIEVISPAASSDLTTLETAKAHLGITGSARDAEITALIRQVSSACARYTGRPTFGRETLRETLRDDQIRPRITLGRDINVELSSIVLDGAPLALADWRLEGPILFPLGWSYYWAGYGADLVVTYDAGYVLLTDLPEDIERAALICLRGWHTSSSRDPMLRSEMVEGVGSMTYAVSAGSAATLGSVPPDAAALLNPYRRFEGL